MTLLFKIIYAAHANGTHHKLALDALNDLRNENAENWQRLFLKHAELYMEGSKAPDKQFKDFKNHVLHPGDSYWGGAPEKARNWYAHLVTALKEQKWSEAVYCAGVLSHYYTDPIHPFHTAQSEAENEIHRAVEWSINRAYDSLRAEGLQHFSSLDIVPPDDETWLEDFVCQGADTSHKQYERLIAHYDFKSGVTDPPAGLDPIARRLIAELLIYAAKGFAHILDRAFADADVTPPRVELTAKTVIATLKIPAKWVLKKIADAEDRRAVQAMFDELQGTGHIEATLPEDVRAVRTLHKKEVLAEREKERRRTRTQRITLASQPRRVAPELLQLTPRPANNNFVISEPPPPFTLPDIPKGPPPVERGISASLIDTVISAPIESEDAESTNETIEHEKSVDKEHKGSVPEITPPPASVCESEPRENPEVNAEPKGLRYFLKGSDNVEAAPVIGPKTAARLETVGVITVDDLLSANPKDIAARINQRHIRARTVELWQDCARLVITVPELRGTHAQLLVGAGYETFDAIAKADPQELSAAVLRFATSKEGTRILRDGTPPDVEKIKSWVENAVMAKAA